jgi:regulator of replication initiation timing
MFENRELQQIFLPMKEEVTEDSRKLYIEGFKVCNSDHILLGGTNQGG